MSNETEHIRIRGARVHNLKAVDIDIPLRKLICFAGPSGSGKTSLAFHTLLAESRRRFVNSFPNSMKFFVDRPAAVDVDEIYPVLPVFGLPQTNPVMGSRSVVADIMRTTEVLQGLYFNYSKEYCPTHDLEVSPVTFSLQLKQASQKLTGDILYLLINAELGSALFGSDFNPTRSWDSKKKVINQFDEKDDSWEVLRFKMSTIATLDSKYADVIKKIEGRPLVIWDEKNKIKVSFNYKSEKKCASCEYAGTKNIRANSFSPHSALGACKTCNGYGANLIFDKEKIFNKDLSFNDDGVCLLKFGPLLWWKKELAKLMKKKKWSLVAPIGELPKDFFKIAEMGEGSWGGFDEVKTYLNSKRYKPAVRVFIRKMQKEEICQDCKGSRLDSSVNNFLIKFGDKKFSLKELGQMRISDFTTIVESSTDLTESHSRKLILELKNKSQLAERMGLGHLSHIRKARTLSAGEYQRLLLLKYLSFNGTGSLFVLDEPSLGLGTNELKILIKGLRALIDQGNTVIVIDHSSLMQKESDYLVIMGPGAGHKGGQIEFSGDSKDFNFEKRITAVKKISKLGKSFGDIEVLKPVTHGMIWKDFKIKKNAVTLIHGPSGSGKTSCLINVLAQNLYKKIHHENLVDEPGFCKSIKGASGITDVIVIDANLNRFTSRSSVGSLTEIAPAVRRHFLKLPVSKSMGLKDGHLSRNSELGMCIRCEGRGHLVIEMQYLEDIILKCEDCNGNGMKQVYANINDGHMTVAQSFSKPLGEVLPQIELTPKFKRTWEYLKILNLDYLSLDRSINSLSGGEKQRIYLLSKLLKKVSNNLLIFENLSFGLSEKELVRVGEFLNDLSQLDNTIIVIDSNPFFQKIIPFDLNF